MQDSDDLERFLFRIVNDEIVRVRVYDPKTYRHWSQIFARSSRQRRIGKKFTRSKHGGFNTISSFGLVPGYEAPDIEEVVVA